MTTQPRTIKFEMNWREAAQIITAALENGTGEGRKAARKELARMADILDAMKASEHEPKTLFEVITQAKHGRPFGQTFDTEQTAAGYAAAMIEKGYQAEVSPAFSTQPTVESALASAAAFYGHPEIGTANRPTEPSK